MDSIRSAARRLAALSTNAIVRVLLLAVSSCALLVGAAASNDPSGRARLLHNFICGE